MTTPSAMSAERLAAKLRHLVECGLVHGAAQTIEEIADAVESLASQPSQTDTGVTDEMVERATGELLAHATCTEGPWQENSRLMRIAARAALTAALTPTPQERE